MLRVMIIPSGACIGETVIIVHSGACIGETYDYSFRSVYW